VPGKGYVCIKSGRVSVPPSLAEGICSLPHRLGVFSASNVRWGRGVVRMAMQEPHTDRAPGHDGMPRDSNTVAQRLYDLLDTLVAMRLDVGNTPMVTPLRQRSAPKRWRLYSRCLTTP
jgi:hypothetical protein